MRLQKLPNPPPRAFWKSIEIGQTYVDEVYRDGDNLWWGAYDSDGNLAAVTSVHKWRTSRPFIGLMGVTKAARGQRMQRRMAKAVLRWAYTHLKHRVETYTYFSNSHSLRNLSAVGFKITGQHGDLVHLEAHPHA